MTKEFGCGMLITLARRVWLIRKTKNNMLVINNKFREIEFTKAVAEKKEKSRASERDEEWKGDRNFTFGRTCSLKYALSGGLNFRARRHLTIYHPHGVSQHKSQKPIGQWNGTQSNQPIIAPKNIYSRRTKKENGKKCPSKSCRISLVKAKQWKPPKCSVAPITSEMRN